MFRALIPHFEPVAHLRRRLGPDPGYFTLDDLKTTRKGQSYHKLMIGNGNITSLTGKEHELVEEAKRHFPDVVGISSTKCRGSNTVEMDDGWKLLYSGV